MYRVNNCIHLPDNSVRIAEIIMQIRKTRFGHICLVAFPPSIIRYYFFVIYEKNAFMNLVGLLV